MQLRQAILGLAFIAAALAGCSSSGGSDGPSVKGATGSAGPYTFTAPGGYDNYTWDLGDHLSRAFGKTVEHTYDFQNGKVNVILTAKKAGSPDKTFPALALTLGNGQNELPRIFLDAQTNWTVTGETVRFSAAASTDADNDPLRFAWSCTRTADAIRQQPHSHGPTGGVVYGSDTRGKVVPRLAATALGESQRKVTGDLCTSLGNIGKSGLANSIEGTFEKTGRYKITLIAGDPKSPSTSGEWDLIVSKPEERPLPIHHFEATGLLNASIPLLPATEGVNVQNNKFPIELDATSFTVDLQMASALPVTDGKWTLLLNDIPLYNGTIGKTSFEKPLKPSSSYNLQVQLVTGAQAAYTVKLDAPLNMDPFRIF